MRTVGLAMFVSMLITLAHHAAGCDRQASEPATCECETALDLPPAGREGTHAMQDLNAVVSSIAAHDLELAGWILDMWRQEASQETWGRIKYCLSLEEPERSECLRKVKGDD